MVYQGGSALSLLQSTHTFKWMHAASGVYLIRRGACGKTCLKEGRQPGARASSMWDILQIVRVGDRANSPVEQDVESCPYSVPSVYWTAVARPTNLRGGKRLLTGSS